MSRTSILAPLAIRRLGLLLALAAAVFIAALFIGTSGISVEQTLHALTSGADEAARAVIMEVRLPRLLAAFGVGGLLAVAGVLLQALFRNPLADSYVLGVSGGSALGALIALLFSASLWWVQTAAAAGAMLATLLVLVLARGGATV